MLTKTSFEEVPMEEIDNILYGGEAENNSHAAGNVETKQAEPESRLLKQRGLEFKLEKIPYYKRPTIHLGFILMLGFPLIWFLMSIFNPGSNAQKKVEENPLEKENEQLRASLTEARQNVNDLKFQRGLKAQEIELIKPLEEVEEEQTKEPEPAPKIAKVQQPVPPRTVTRPVVYRQARTIPTFNQRLIEPKIIEKEPEIDPMEQWLAQAQRGYAVSSLEKVPYRSIASGQPSYQVASSNTNIQKELQNIPVNSQEPPSITERALSSRQQGKLLDSSYLEKAQKQETLWNDDEFKARLQRGSSYLANRAELLARRQPITLKTRALNQLKPPPPNQTRQITQKERTNNYQNKILDIGSQAKGTLNDGIAWTDESTTRKKYILQLKEGFKNSGGREILPRGTKLIARITKLSRSGLFDMEVTHIKKSLDEPKIAVPPGTLEIISSDGSPLKAKLKQKGGGSSFLGDVGAIVAPGVERVLDTADDLILNGDSISVRRNNRDPLKSGLSGVAEGVGNVLERSLRNGDRSRAASYFQFDNQTVRIVVNEDFYLP